MATANDLNISQAGMVAFDGTATFSGRTITGGTGITVTDGNGVSGNPVISLTGGGAAVEHLTGNTGGALNPDGSNNFNIITANSTVKVAGSGSTLTQDFGLSNLLIGSSGAITSGASNTAVGNLALSSTTSGTHNSAFGLGALEVNLLGSDNTAIGYLSLISYAPASATASNTAVGSQSLDFLLTGTLNTCVGATSGTNYQHGESSNILLGTVGGLGGESNVIRIGNQGSGSGQQNTAFLAGVTGVTTAASAPVAVDSNGQLSSLGFGTATNVLTSNGAGTSPTWQAAGGGGSGFTSINYQAFTTNGTYTPTASMKYCIVEIIGGGGGGGGAAATGGATSSLGSGGGAGEFARAIFSAATIGVSQTVTIGAAGAANSGASGGNAGNSSVGALISANGGIGGITLPATNIGGEIGGLGGSGGSGGTFDSPGAPGGPGMTNPGAGWLWSGYGGSSPYGSGGQGLVSTTYPITDTVAGKAALGFGSGGGGAINGVSQSAQAGGAGTAGYVLVTEYI